MTASAIRERVRTIRPKHALNLSTITTNGLVHLFSRTFGRSPPDDFIRQAKSLAKELNVKTLPAVSVALEHVTLRDRVASAYARAAGRVSNEEIFLAAIRAASGGAD